MKKMVLVFTLVLFISEMTFAQSITVVDPKNANEKTTIIIQTDNSNIPLYRPLGSYNINTFDKKIIVNQFEYIANAPTTLSLTTGLYTLQMYTPGEIGSRKFTIDASGGEQIWQLNARKPIHVPSFWVGLVSLSTTALMGVLHATNTGKWEFYNIDPDFFDRPTFSTDLSLGVLIGSAVISAGSWIVFACTGPTATRTK